MNENVVKIALVGCGWISEAHVKGYASLYQNGCRDFEIVASCDLNEEAAEQKARMIEEFQGKKPEIVTGVEKLATAGMIDAADLCLPHCFHHSAALPLLENGIHVLLEKPLGITIKASRKMIDAAQNANIILATAENTRRDIMARACRWAVIEEKMIGDIRFGDIQAISNSQFDFTDPKFKWRGAKMLTGGGMIMDSGAHFTDMMLCLFGEPDEIHCSMYTRDRVPMTDVPMLGDTTVDIEDAWHAFIRFHNGVEIDWRYSRVQPAYNNRQGIFFGSEGIIEDQGFPFHTFSGGGKIIMGNGTVREKEWIKEAYLNSLSDEEKEQIFPYGVTDGFAVEIADFVRAVKNNGTVELDGDAGLKAKAVCEACYESATIGKPVKYVDILNGTIDEYQKPINDFWKI